jgi:hypothetical protein
VKLRTATFLTENKEITGATEDTGHMAEGIKVVIRPLSIRTGALLHKVARISKKEETARSLSEESQDSSRGDLYTDNTDCEKAADLRAKLDSGLITPTSIIKKES